MNARDMNKHSKTDWQKLAAIRDDEIDYTDIPSLDDHFFDRATLRVPGCSDAVVTLQMDTDVFAWFQSQKGGWETRIRRALRSYVEAHKKEELSHSR